ncbi:hypothetical protein FRC12_016450 [Ceratobasidium sp. 428]|nr:hypothetical protein FRC09_009472 [Ceratobasidium sp. 395]KAG8786574.1 hypothetical protein FRC12_016450 [Ceratobasidium sp. 428]
MVSYVAAGLKKVANSASLVPVVGDATQVLDDEHDLLDALLHPLQRVNLCGFISTFGSRSDTHLPLGGKSKESHSAISSVLAASASSSRTLERLRGMEVHVKELCATWTGQVTSRFTLSRIEWFRETQGARHEYLIANINSDSSLTPQAEGLWLRLERRPKEGLVIERKRDHLTRLFGQFPADDLITISRRRGDLLHRDGMKDKFQTSMSFKNKVTLGYILDVLKIIHEESPTYHLAGANCWFFASTVVEILDRKARAIWAEEKTLEWFDHWTSKNWVNYDQYKAILRQIKRLDIH